MTQICRGRRLRLGVLTSHPIQYQTPLYRELQERLDLRIYYAHHQSPEDQARAGFGVAFDWDVDLLSGHDHKFIKNIARRPAVDAFFGCDTPEIRDEIVRQGFDAFLVMGWHLKSYWQAVRACRRLGVPVMVRGDSQLATPRSRLKRTAKELLYPRLLRQFDAFLYVGQRAKEYLEHYGVGPERLFFSPHCVDNAWFAERAGLIDRTAARRSLGFAPEEQVVLFVGKYLEHKRPLDLIRATAALRERGLALRVAFAGGGPLAQAIEAEARTLRVPVTLLGFRNQTELPAVYRATDVLVLPSEGETWGLVVNEALACGTPVVVSEAVGCAPDLVNEARTGMVFPVGDVSSLAECLSTVLHDPPSAEIIRRTIFNYSISAAADGILRAMDCMCSGDSRGPGL